MRKHADSLVRCLLAITAVLCIFGFAVDGLQAYFTTDDLMNAYGYWARPTSQLIKESVFFYHAESFRPVGALFYGPLFALFGLNPLPYRVVCFALLLANLGLMYLFCFRLSRSREVAALACLIGAYHAHLGDLYYNSGTIYDLLCFSFFYTALIYYMKIRDDGSIPGLWQTAALLALYIGALGAKEMAVALPVVVAVYEMVFHSPRQLASSRFLLTSVPITIAYIISKTTGPDSMVRVGDYYPHLSLPVFMAGWEHYLFELFYASVRFSHLGTITLWLFMLLIAYAAHRRDLIFAWWALMIGVLPVIFITPRGLYGIYMTLPAWYLFLSVCLIMLRDLLMGAPRRISQVVLFAAVALLILPIHRREKSLTRQAPASNLVRLIDEQLTARHPSMPPGANILFLSEPFDRDDQILTFLLRLHYRDKEIHIDRVKVMGAVPDAEARKQYQGVFAITGDSLSEVR